MRLSRFRRSSKIGMNMTPMIDIVFLLIIFFMTVSQITQSLDEPIDLTDVGPNGQPLETVSVTINLTASGQKIVAGKSYSLPDLMIAIGKEMRRMGNQPERLKILVRCDQNCPGRHINELTQELGKTGISKIRLSVEGQQRE